MPTTPSDEPLHRSLALDRALLIAGLEHRQRRETERARACFERVLALDAEHPDALHFLAQLDAERGDFDGALAKVDRAIAVYPRHAAFHDTRARILRALGRADEGSASRPIDEGDDVETLDRDARFALAKRLAGTTRFAEAADVLGAVVAADPDDLEAIAARADSLVQVGATEEARRSAERALERHPASLRVALRARLALKPVHRDGADLDACRASYAEGLRRLRDEHERYLALPSGELRDALAWSNFYLAYQGRDDRALQSEYADFVAGLLDRAVPHLRQPLPMPVRLDRRIRIGFASRFFYECTVGRYFRGWVRGLDRQRFEVHVYALQPSLDELGRSIRDAVDVFRPPEPGCFVGDTIRADALDVLVYPELGMDGATFLLAALRLAPIQCAGWGHPVTTGHATIDHFFTSDRMEPANAATHYRESLVRLPGLGTDYAPPTWDEATMPAARARLGLPADRRLYLFPQSVHKNHPDNDALLAEVLARDVRGNLLVFPGHTPETTEQWLRRLSGVLAHRGLDVHERVVVLPLMSRATYMQVNAACDVMLDSLHFSGGNTSLDAFAAGLPVVTLPGSFMRGRQTLGMVEALGIPELAARDAEDYVDRAIAIASDPARRAALSATIRERRGALFGDRSAIAAMQDFYLARLRAS